MVSGTFPVSDRRVVSRHCLYAQGPCRDPGIKEENYPAVLGGSHIGPIEFWTDEGLM